jgi:hypothetical protein
VKNRRFNNGLGSKPNENFLSSESGFVVYVNLLCTVVLGTKLNTLGLVCLVRAASLESTQGPRACRIMIEFLEVTEDVLTLFTVFMSKRESLLVGED